MRMTIPTCGERSRQEAVVLEARVVSGSGGGPDKTILKSPRFLTNAGYRTVCAYLHPPQDAGFDELRRKAARYGAPLAPIPDSGPCDWTVVPRLLDLCRRENVAIWHGHDYKSNALGLLLRRFWPMRLVTTVHGWVKHTRRTPVYYWIDRFCLPRYETVICVSEDLRDACLRCGVAPRRCLLIDNAIDTEEYSRRWTVVEAKVAAGIPVQRQMIGAVGRLSAEKGFDLLIRAAAQLLRDGHDLELRIIGEGDQGQELQALITELGCQDRVRLMGYRSNLIDLYQAMDVFALSSHREGLPNVLLEAMALEVPVVATRIAGIPRLIEDGQNGLLVGAGDVNELRHALGKLLGDVALRTRIGEAARRTVESDFSFDVRMEKVRKVYDSLLRGSRAGLAAAC